MKGTDPEGVVRIMCDICSEVRVSEEWEAHGKKLDEPQGVNFPSMDICHKCINRCGDLMVMQFIARLAGRIQELEKQAGIKYDPCKS